ncbi:MAG: sterol desaturase [Rhodospirillales bacterium CG15_BIG_FIL_POST_REV_8_21_14_020_66_15]|nr:MAG: sterol desaturase [Rhodospirillales bacterium CG15_BIG_FIL_POST_REV_8_21_14_020_66_15]
MTALNDFIAANEPLLRLGCFAGMLAAMMGAEALWPKRPGADRGHRWPRNAALVLLDTLAVRAVAWALPAFLPVAAAALAADRGWGLFPALGVDGWAAFLLTLVLFDLAIYAQHVAVHYIPVLWRLHRVHHTDLAFDTTTGVRFHPLEILLSIAIKVGLVLMLGAPAAAVVVFEVVLNATSLFNHANLALPGWLDAALRRVLVTPDMHRVHHSVHRDETDSNFGFNLSVWDRLFGTYRAQPRDGHDAMALGVGGFRDPARLGLGGLLVQPFRKP